MSLKTLLCLMSLCFIQLITAEDNYCSQCLYPIWHKTLTTNQTELCDNISILDDMFSCVETCDTKGLDRPESYKIRQLTQISDIMTNLLQAGCFVDEDDCGMLASCVSLTANYNISFGPHTSLFNYSCNTIQWAEAMNCVLSAGPNCITQEITDVVVDILEKGNSTVCGDNRRCLTHGNIYEVYPGSDCTQYIQEAAAYGPSTGLRLYTQEGLGFSPQSCRPEFLNSFICPEDSTLPQIYSELPARTDETAEANDDQPLSRVSVNLQGTCGECLQPIWFTVVTNNGSRVCDFIDSHLNLINECAVACVEAERNIQQYIEYVVKLSDIHMSLEINFCPVSSFNCDDSYCLSEMVNYYPLSAPHTTANNFNCSEGALSSAVSCFLASCPDAAAATGDVITAMIKLIQDAYNGICLSDVRCMTYGNIYELVPYSEVDLENEPNVTACAHYRQAPATGYYVSAINRVDNGLIFDMGNCWADYPENSSCPESISQA